MQSPAWSRLLRFLPAALHNSLVLVTANRTEISVQALVRFEEDFVAVKGRLAATQLAGRVFFVPYANIDYVAFQNEVKDADFAEMFAGFDATASPPPPPEPPAPEAPAPPPAPPEEAPAADAPVGPTVRTPAPIKSAVLERFRARNSSPGVVLRPTADSPASATGE